MNLSETTKQAIFSQWSFLTEVTLKPTRQGSNNTTYFVHTLDKHFVLKLYAETVETAQIDYEHSLLAFLQHADLSFAVPVPIKTSSGKTLISVKIDERSLNVVLLPQLIGQPLNRQNLDQVQASGLALAELHEKLSQFDLQGQLARLPFWGKLAQIHPHIQNPLDIPQILSLGLEEQTSFCRMLNEVMESVPHLYAKLPLQTIHADYITPNILLDRDRVVGVLDFEFATYDLRLFDYLSSLDQFASFPWKEPLFEDILQAFSRGYRKRSSLTVAEREAVVLVWKLQRTSSLVYWTGLLLEGKGDRKKIVDAVLETLEFESWLETNHHKLLDDFN